MALKANFNTDAGYVKAPQKKEVVGKEVNVKSVKQTNDTAVNNYKPNPTAPTTTNNTSNGSHRIASVNNFNKKQVNVEKEKNQINKSIAETKTSKSSFQKDVDAYKNEAMNINKKLTDKTDWDKVNERWDNVKNTSEVVGTATKAILEYVLGGKRKANHTIQKGEEYEQKNVDAFKQKVADIDERISNDSNYINVLNDKNLDNDIDALKKQIETDFSLGRDVDELREKLRKLEQVKSDRDFAPFYNSYNGEVFPDTGKYVRDNEKMVKDLANDYPKAMIQNQEAAAEHLKNYLFGPNQLNLPQRWYVQNGNSYRPEYQGSLMQYEFFIMAGDNLFAEIVINENGEIYRRTKYEMNKIN